MSNKTILEVYIERNSPDQGYWGEHPLYSESDWRYEVSEGITKCGYWEWCYKQEEVEEE